MSPLSNELRSMLERAIIKAREVAEEAALAALTTLAVMRDEPFASLNTEQRRLRNSLRAKARQLGDGSFTKGFQPLVEEIAYEQWHSRLFARFLAENNLLMHPAGIPVTLEECDEMAPQEREADGWQLAVRYASAMLPGIFRADDPAMQVQFSPEGRHKLERIITDLPSLLFVADDTLGWVYQFWQTKKKKEVNDSGRKIGGKDLPPVTQLFTEHYMVQFLLENSLGAWWATRHPESPLLKQFTYLRFKDDGTPAAGIFPGWPEYAARVTVMDPCCGSGHFLVAAFEMLRQMRMEEEGLSETQAADAVLCDNLFGLEIDLRCTQIAAFALALAAWKVGGYRQLPVPNIACSGIAVVGQLETWTRLARDDVNLRMTLERHYHLFCNAPDLGSLINPNNVPLQDRMFSADYTFVEPLLKRALAKERIQDDPIAIIFGTTAEGVARATRLLAGTYTLVATNVPFLGRGDQYEILIKFCDVHHQEAKTDLAAAFIERCKAFVSKGGSYAVVSPQSWLYQNYYKNMRVRILNEQTWNHISRLGTRAFETINGEVVNVALLIITNQAPENDQVITGIDASTSKIVHEKINHLRKSALYAVKQSVQFSNPDIRISLTDAKQRILLSSYASCYQGMKTGDDAKLRRYFWEFPGYMPHWRFYESTVEKTIPYGGREFLLSWKQHGHDMARLQGTSVWGKNGIAVSQMGELPVTLYNGDAFDSNAAVIIPKDPAYLPAIWAFCQSPEYNTAVRRIDQKLGVTNATLVKVPFDLQHWQKVADGAGPLPKPYSNDLTQWLFDGFPTNSTQPLHAAVARLLGYCWPKQKSDLLDPYIVKDGIICLSAITGEERAAERLRALLAQAYGETWSPMQQDRLLAGVGFAGKNLDVWLREGFFVQHCSLFHNRPFIWHIWDGLKDGFSAFVNYHRLDASCLDRLIYTYLGSWTTRQKAECDAGVSGAEARLVAAINLQKKLEAIRDGEKPYDIYIRWKPMYEQPIGWNPDLEDGVRVNIRPFVTAGVLRSRFTINWNKDRGTNPDGSERLNDLHYTLAQKREAKQMIVI